MLLSPCPRNLVLASAIANYAYPETELLNHS